MRSRPWLTRGAIAALAAGLVLLAGLLAYGAYLWTVLALPKGQDRAPVLIYGASLLLEPGLHVDEAYLTERLDHLGYDAVSSAVEKPGQYAMGEDFADLYLRDLPEAHFKGFPLRLHLEDGRVTRLTSLLDGEELMPVPLEPPLLSGVRGGSRQIREWVGLGSLPRHVIQSVLAVEDHRFYHHLGVDPRAVLRALWVNVKSGDVVQGGSTITQQLAKNLFYTHRRSLLRKVKEAAAALVLESKYSKYELLESYLNEIYLGQAGSVAIYGVGEAAQRYFGKPVQEVTLSEGALLAGLIKAPNTYSPWKNPHLAAQRRDLVLRRLYEEGAISETAWQGARGAPLGVATSQESLPDAPYFMDYLLTRTEAVAGGPLPAGAKILSTLDPVLQRFAEETLRAGLEQLETRHPVLTGHSEALQGALVALDPRSGAILAMVGGRDYRSSQFNRAVQARRQPGSLFKALVYLAAFEAGASLEGEPLTPASKVLDEPVTFSTATSAWSPQNYDREFRGAVTVRTALEQSLNVPAVRVAQAVGVGRLVDICRRMGLEAPLPENLSIALGTAEVTLLEISAAFGVLAQAGFLVPPTPVRGIVAPTGDTVWHGIPEGRQAVSPESAYLVTSLLRGAVERGTARQAKALGVGEVVAGKTGTTDGYRDAWFVGYTPELVVGVWVGFDDGGTVGLSGSQAALPLWADFARRVIPSHAAGFPVPRGILTRRIDPVTGQLATSRCPETMEEVFVAGTEPTEYCPVHGVGWWARIKQRLGL